MSESDSSTPNQQLVRVVPQYPCALCKGVHSLARCTIFKALPPRQRCKTAQAHGYCLNCLAKSHTGATCTSPDRCKHCGAPHHTMLHDGPVPTPPRRESARQPQTQPRPARDTTRSQVPRRGGRRRRVQRGTTHCQAADTSRRQASGAPRIQAAGTSRVQSSGTTHSQATGAVMTAPAMRAAISGLETSGHRGREAFRLLGETLWLLSRQV